MRIALLIFLGAAILPAQNKPLTNQDIIEMTRARVPARTIVTMINSQSDTFDVSPQAVIALSSAGVDPEVMNRMIALHPGAGKRAFGVATGTFPVADAAGKKVRLSAWIKTDNVQDGYAGIWWRVDGAEKKVLAFDNSSARVTGPGEPSTNDMRGATGTTEWTRYTFELPVAQEATNINFGLLFTGTGTAWFDGITVELDGLPYSNPDKFDFDFEGPGAKGFYTGGAGYRVGPDKSIAHSGKQSLKMALAQ
jgi:hypothetical protein